MSPSLRREFQGATLGTAKHLPFNSARKLILSLFCDDSSSSHLNCSQNQSSFQENKQDFRGAKGGRRSKLDRKGAANKESRKKNVGDGSGL